MTLFPNLHKNTFTLLLTLLLSFAVVSPAHAIVNGINSPLLAGQVQIYSQGAFLCGGTLISPRWVLTAEHCFSNPNATLDNTVVLIGDERLSFGEQHAIANAFAHPVADIWLLNLATPTALTGVVVGYGVGVPAVGDTVLVRGWGSTSQNAYIQPDVLQQAAMVVTDNQANDPGYSPLGSTLRTQSAEGAYPTNGDSGNGVTSLGILCGVHVGVSPNYTSSLEVKTDYLYPWIYQTSLVPPSGRCDLDPTRSQPLGGSLRVMPIGSGETVGYEDGNGYRSHLYNDLSGATLNPNFVGPDTAGAPPSNSLTGAFSDYIQDNQNEAACSVYNYAPDIVTLETGEDDIAFSNDVANAPSRLDSLVSTIQEVSPSTTILVASIAPSNIPAYTTSIQQYNSAIKTLVLARKSAGQHVDFVDTGYLSTTEGEDIISHENGPTQMTPGGYFKVASGFNLALDTAINAGWIPTSKPLFQGPCNGIGGRSTAPPPAGGTDGKFLNHAALLGSLPDQDWLFANIPFLDVPDTQIQQVYYYRWHVFKEHLLYTSAAYGWLSTEFLNPVSYGAPFGGIDAAAGHQTIEGRWLRDQDYMKDNINYWLNGPGQFPKPQDFNDNPDTSDWAHEYSYWAATSVWQWFLATGDAQFATGLLPQLVKQYRGWDNHFNPGLGLYWQFPVWDATEYSPASFESSDPYHGGAGYRPTINSYQFGDARAIAQLAAISGDSATASEYQGRASALQAAVQQYLWDPGRNFYYHMNRDNNPSNTLLDSREEEGFVPWMFELPPNNAEAGAFQELLDPDGFSSAYGPPTAERRSQWFMFQAATCCHWDGPSWPYETSQTLTGLANQLIDYPPQSSISVEDYVNLLHTYAATQFKNGVPYVAEAHDPDANDWIYDTPNHSEDYNHSTYNDNVLSGLLGLRGQPDNSLLISPLVPSSWSYFGIEDVPYHGHDVTVLWDPFGTRYQQGDGLTVFVDQKNVLHQSSLTPVRVNVGAPILQADPVHVLSQPVALGTYTITNVLTGKVMGVENEYPFDGAQIQQYADNGSPDHAWSLEDAGNGYYKIRNIASNLVLGVDQESTADSALIKQAHDNGTLDHFWSINDTGGGQLQIQNLNSGLLLGISFESAANGANVVQFHDNGTPDHLWTVQPIPDPRNSVVYTIENANSSKVLAVEGASVADGAQIQQYDDNGTPDHLWALELQGSNDIYILRNLQSGLVLGVDGESKKDSALIKQAQDNGTPDHLWGFRIDSTTSNGSKPQKIENYNSRLLLGVTDESLDDSANVVQFKDSGTPDHLWTFNPILDPRSRAFFKIVNVNSGKVLGVQNESLADGAQIQQSDDNGTKDQIWQLGDGGNNLYKIHNWASDLTLGVDQESKADSALIKQAQDNGTPDHIWQFIDAGNGQFKILNTNSGLLLGVDQESQSDGANIVQFQDSGTPDHLWRLEVTVLP